MTLKWKAELVEAVAGKTGSQLEYAVNNIVVWNHDSVVVAALTLMTAPYSVAAAAVDSV